MSSAKTTEAIMMPFGFWTRVGPRNHVLDDGGPDPHVTGAVLMGEGAAHCKV